MVTAGNGTAVFKGMRTGKQYQVNFYSSDVIGAYVTFSFNGLAGTGSQNNIYFSEPVCIVDTSFASTNTVTTNFVPQANDQNVGVVVPLATILTTLPTRSTPRICFKAGTKITMLQA